MAKPIEDDDNAKEFWENLSDANPLDPETRTAIQQLLGVHAANTLTAETDWTDEVADDGMYFAFGTNATAEIVSSEVGNITITNLGKGAFNLRDVANNNELQISPFETVFFSTVAEGGGEFSFDVDSRFRAADDSGVVKTSGNQTVAGNKTWSGQQRATSQTASTGDALMTRDLTDGLYSRSLTASKTGVTIRSYNASLVADPDFVFPSVPVGSYAFRLLVSANLIANTSLRWAIGGTAVLTTNTYHRARVGINSTLSTLTSWTGGSTVPQNGGMTPFIIEGMIMVATAGSVSFDWANNTDAGVNLNLGVGYITLTKL